MNIRDLRHWLPEMAIILIALYFIWRNLGTFPDPWDDDALFMIVARHLAEGRGYALPAFRTEWVTPNLLAVGPTIILPSALFIKLFGFSVAIARIPQALYLMATSLIFYIYTKEIAGKWAARWTAILLVTLSAYINLGKPLMGEIPGFFFLMLGLLAFSKPQTRKRAVMAGVWFGLAVVTKLSCGIIYPALFVVWVIAILKRNKHEWKTLTVTGIVSVLVFIPWRMIESIQMDGFWYEMATYAFADSGTAFLRVLTEQPELLLRFPYLYFGGLFILGSVGIWSLRRNMRWPLFVLTCTLILLFVIYFLNGGGWYRHLIFAHLTLLPFVPTGAKVILRKKLAILLLSFFVLAQGWWQLTYHGARPAGEATEAAKKFVELYTDETVVIRRPEMYVILPYKENWLFVGEEIENRAKVEPQPFPVFQNEHCYPVLRKFPDSEKDQYQGKIVDLFRRYRVVEPVKPCTPHNNNEEL